MKVNIRRYDAGTKLAIAVEHRGARKAFRLSWIDPILGALAYARYTRRKR